MTERGVFTKPSREHEEQTRAAGRLGRRREAYWREKYQQLWRDYPDQYVALRDSDGSIAAVASSLADLDERLAAVGLGPGEASIEFMDTMPNLLAR